MKTKSKDKVHVFTIVFLMFIFILTFVITQYNGFYDHRTQDEINNAIILKNLKYKSANNDRLVYLTGELDYDEHLLHDELFDIYLKTPKLSRYVETYQWVEHINMMQNGDKEYIYTKEWKTDLIDSTKFHEKKYKNPTKKYAENKLFEQQDIKIGDFNISKDVYNEIYNKKILFLNRHVVLPKGFKIHKVHITNAKDFNNPEIGDTRVIYFYSDWSTVTILAKQNKKTLEKYTTKNNEQLVTIIEGKQKLSEIAKNYIKYIAK